MSAPRRGGSVRTSPKKQTPTAEAKVKVLDGIAAGLTRDAAMAAVGRKLETYRSWMKDDAAFKASIERLRDGQAARADNGRLPVPDFPEFCAELGMPMYEHQRRMWDVIHGGQPTDLDDQPLMKYVRGAHYDPAKVPEVPGGRVIVNGPPGFAKSTTFTVLWVLWLIHKDPNIRIILVSKTQGSAIKQLGRIKWYLTSSVNRELQAKYAPEGGWKDAERSWTQTQIFVQGNDSGEKDPTVEALGVAGQIFGARADLIILDDVVTLANVGEYEKHITWLEQEVETRLDGRGMLLLLNTRIAPVDLFSELRDITDADDEPVYTYFSQPALLSEGDGTVETWVSLWPEGYPVSRLRKVRRRADRWALVYQQQDVAEDAIFNARAVEASVNSQRFPGPMTEAGMGHRPGGMSGLYVVGGLDPATVGHTSMQVWGLDRLAEKRYVLDGFNQRNTTPQVMKDTVKRLTDTYKINEWVIERNAFQRYLTQDAELTGFLRSRGCRLTEHYTTDNKYDADFGIAAMAPLFLSCGLPPSNGGGGLWEKTPTTALIELPNPRQNAWISEYINQLVTWQPSGLKQGHKTDLVMAGWFCEIAVQRILGHGRKKQTHLHNPYASRASLRRRTTINIAEWREAQLAEVS